MKIFSRYFLKELIFPFFMSMGIISFLLIMNRLITLVDLVLKYGVNPWVVLRLIAYILPATFAITVPMSLLVAILLSWGRFSADMELTAIKAGGVSLPSLFRPVFGLALLISFLMLSFNEYILPKANLGYKILFYDIVRKRSNVLIQENTYIRDFEGFIIHVGQKDKESGRLEDITLFLLPQGQTPLQVVTAQWGQLVSDPKTLRVYLELHQGSVQSLAQEDSSQFTQMFFDTDVIDVDIQGGLRQVQGLEKNPQEMPIAEIRQQIAQMAPQDPKRFSWGVEMHKKIAIPFACLAFAIIGCPLGALVRRGGRLLGFVFGLLLIFDYYLFLSFGETYATAGHLPAWFAMWLPNMQLMLVGSWLSWVVLRERSLNPFHF